jgi:hypothetical protein
LIFNGTLIKNENALNCCYVIAEKFEPVQKKCQIILVIVKFNFLVQKFREF